MQSDGDLLLDRKRLKSRLAVWRLLAILCVFGFAALYFNDFGLKSGGMGRNYIAWVEVDGILLDDKKRDEMFDEIARDKNAKALIVRFNSPGGTTVGGEELFLQLREVAKNKPVVATMRTVCASACYMAALGTDYMLARDGTLTGSIGVMLQSAEITRMADKLGITPITVKSGKYKDIPSLTSPFTEEDRAVVGEVVKNAYENFVSLIVKRRGMTDSDARTLADGRVYTGSQAVQNRLIDGLGGEKEALLWLSSREVNPRLELKELRPEPEFESLFSKFAENSSITKIFGRMSVGLDGLISIWQISP